MNCFLINHILRIYHPVAIFYSQTCRNGSLESDFTLMLKKRLLDERKAKCKGLIGDNVYKWNVFFCRKTSVWLKSQILIDPPSYYDDKNQFELQNSSRADFVDVATYFSLSLSFPRLHLHFPPSVNIILLIVLSTASPPSFIFVLFSGNMKHNFLSNSSTYC